MASEEQKKESEVLLLESMELMLLEGELNALAKMARMMPELRGKFIKKRRVYLKKCSSVGARLDQLETALGDSP